MRHFATFLALVSPLAAVAEDAWVRMTGDEIAAALDGVGARYQRLSTSEMVRETAKAMAEEKVIGWFQGRMEFGPRALGGR